MNSYFLPLDLARSINRNSALTKRSSNLRCFQSIWNSKNSNNPLKPIAGSHPNILSFYGSLNQYSESLCSKVKGSSIFLEFSEENCRKKLKNAALKGKFLSKAELREILKGISNGLYYLEKNGIKMEYLAMESIYLKENIKVKIFPECLFRRSKPSSSFQDQNDLLCEIMIDLASLNYKNKYRDYQERLKVIEENYGIGFVEEIFNGCYKDENLICKQIQIKGYSQAGICKKNESPPRHLTKNLVSFQDESFFMSPIKSEAQINEPLSKTIRTCVANKHS